MKEGVPLLLTVFCTVMLLAFLVFLIATESAYVLFGAILMIFLLTAILRRPIRYRPNRWIFVFYRWTLRIVPASEQIVGNPNEIVFYKQNRRSRNSHIAVSAGEEQIVSGCTLYSYRRHRLFVLFPVPAFCKAAWHANLFFACVTAAALTGLAMIGYQPYQRLRHTKALLANTAQITPLHAESEDILDDPVLDNVLLICRGPENEADLLEMFCFRHSDSEVMPLYLNPALLAETAPAQYQTVSEYCKAHSTAEITALIESQFYLRTADTVSLSYESLCDLAEKAGGIPVTMSSSEAAGVNLALQAAGSPALLPVPQDSTEFTVSCSWEQIRAFLNGANEGDDSARALRHYRVTMGLLSVYRGMTSGKTALPEKTQGIETSFTPERLYRLTDTVRSDRTHYASAFAACHEPDAVVRCCVPRTGNYRLLQNHTVYTVPGIIRQYIIRLIYYA